jgi:hypothetical protein
VVEGTVIRFTVPSTREAYDQDLRRFNDRMHEALQRLAATAAAHPGTETDILGTLELAVLSDFIQEDPTNNFSTDRALADETSARNLAARLAKERRFTLRAQGMFLGSLPQ